MKKFSILNFKFSIFLVSIFYILYSIFYIPTVIAVDSTPSAEIKSKLEELKKEIASKAAKLKQETFKKLQNKAYVGQLKVKSQTSLTLATRSGPKLVSINQDTVFESEIKSKSKYSLKAMLEEDYVAALGDVDENGVLTAKKVILLKETSKNTFPQKYLWGKIVSISDELATLKDRNSKNIAVSLPSSSKVKLYDFVILTGSYNKNDIFETRFVYVIPQGGVLKPKKIATPSAKLSSPSATPKSTKP